jgi:anti-anti-sigma factor
MTIRQNPPGDNLAYSIREEMGECMPIDIWYDGEVWIFRPSGRIDAGHSADLDAALSEGISQGMRYIVLDLTDTPYIASSGLRAIIKAAKSVKPNDGKIAICGMNDVVREVFRLSGLSRIFQEFSILDDAIACLQPAL